MSDTVRHRECPNVHLGGASVCRDCRRLYERDAKKGLPGSRATSGEADPVQLEQTEEPGSSGTGGEDVSEASKSERLEVARRVLSNAEKCRRYRERKKLTDPEFLSREAERMKARRKK